MALDHAQEQKIKAWMRAKFPGGLSCPACQQRARWNISDIVVPPHWVPDGAVSNDRIAPMVPIVCGNCGNILLFSAVLLFSAFPIRLAPSLHDGGDG